MRLIGKLLLAALVVGVAIQFVRPGIGHPPVTAELQGPEDVRAILKGSCYNCHSNETRLSWFDQPAPVYWMVAADVKEARRHLNFSEIGKLPAAQQRGMLFEAVNQVRLGAMQESVITPEKLAVLERYLAPFGDAGSSEASAHPAETTAAVTALRPVVSTRVIGAAPNGLQFFPGYQAWKPISTTDRGDNHTLRLILGNDIAIKAIAEKKIMPWPDGATFAKVAWEAVPDSGGGLTQGKFLQVEFMVKDAAKYASTAGWGFGRWRGMDLKPYGKDAQFAGECVGCHTPVKGNDYV
jgi:hypothetical protein